MKNIMAIILLGAAVAAVLLTPYPLFAQACQGDEAAVEAYQKSLTDLVDKVQKENLQEFQRDYHEQSCLTTLTLCYTAAGEAVSCLEKMEKDPTATRDLINAEKAKRDAYAKLHAKIGQDRNALKAAKKPEDAKALIAKFEFSAGS